MDGSRFDSLARAMATPTSRRGAIKTLLGAVAAGVAIATGGAAGSAADPADRSSQADAARRRPFWRRGEPCESNQQCGRLVPCTIGICMASQCEIDGGAHPVGRNPNNSCEYCVPSRDPGVPDAWQPFPVGFACPDQFEATACLTTIGTCNADAECVPTPEPDGTLCGPSQTCCRGVCCTATECCNAAGACEECGPHCVIDYVTHLEGAGHPDGSCNVCEAADFSFWTTAPDRFACGPNRDQVCCNGSCCDPGECCGPTGQCEACEPECAVNGSWCGPNHNQTCCNGECCPYGAYCGRPESCACCAPSEHCNGGVCEPR